MFRQYILQIHVIFLLPQESMGVSLVPSVHQLLARRRTYSTKPLLEQQCKQICGMSGDADIPDWSSAHSLLEVRGAPGSLFLHGQHYNRDVQS
jgi:hypothetical protein